MLDEVLWLGKVVSLRVYEFIGGITSNRLAYAFLQGLVGRALLFLDSFLTASFKKADDFGFQHNS